jgi:hypothetical protein
MGGVDVDMKQTIEQHFIPGCTFIRAAAIVVMAMFAMK